MRIENLKGQLERAELELQALTEKRGQASRARAAALARMTSASPDQREEASLMYRRACNKYDNVQFEINFKLSEIQGLKDSIRRVQQVLQVEARGLMTG